MFSFGEKWYSVLSFNIMQKEDLIKRLRLFAVITTTVFVVLVVALLVQFGFIAYYHAEIRELNDRNQALTEQIDGLEKDIKQIEETYAHDKQIQKAGEQQQG